MKLTEEQRALAGDPGALALAERMAREYATRKRSERHLDEYRSAALEALCEAARKYDPATGYAFTTLAGAVIWARLRDCSRVLMRHGLGGSSIAARRGRLADQVSLDVSRFNEFDGGGHVGSGRAASWAADLPDPGPPPGWALECEEEVRRLTRGLGAGGAVVRLLLLRAEFGGTARRVAEHMGLCETRVSQLLAQALADLCRRRGVPVPADGRGALGLRGPEPGESLRAAKRRYEAKNREKRRLYDAERYKRKRAAAQG